MSRWLRTGAPPDVVIEVARAYGGDPIAGLVAAGWLTIDDLVPHFRNSLRVTPQTYLTEELHRRSTVWEQTTLAGQAFVPWWYVDPSRGDGSQPVSAG